MPDRYSEWDDYRLKRRSEPIPPDAADTPAAEAFSPAVVWASSGHAEDVRPDDLGVRPSSPLASPDPPRSKTLPILLGIAGVTVLTTLIAVPVVTHLTGRSSHEPSAARRQPPPAGTGTTPPLPPVSPSTTGPGCGGGTYKRVGFYVDGKAGWLSGSGGYSGAGCDGRFDALPMSGDVKKADPSLYAQWEFDPGLRHQCKVAFYIPNNSDKTYVGGSPAHYKVQQEKDNKGLLSFSIDQPRSIGQWVSSAAFKVDGPFYVRLANTGKDWTDTKNTYTHVVAAQARTVCS